MNYYLSGAELELTTRLFRERYPSLADSSMLIADKACRNELMIPYTNDLTRWIYMGEELDWLYNPTNDLEYTWGINRHWHMLDLGKAYLLTGDEKYVETYKRHFCGWCAQNPPPQLPYDEAVYFQLPGPWRLLETGLRVQSWIAAYCYMEASPGMDEAFKTELLRALELHADYLTRYLGDTDINHAIMHMQGLFMIGVFHDKHARAPYWRQLAMERLQLCQFHQIGPEGVQSELTTHYHDASIEMFGTPYLLGKLAGYPFPESYGSQLQRMATFSLAMLRPDQRSTAVGDSDWVSNGRERVALLGAILDNETLIAEGAVSAELLWLVGADRYMHFMGLQQSGGSMRGNQEFPQTGYYALRDESQYLFFDAAPMGGAHGHADALQFEWYWKRQLMFVDPGRYTYEEGEWRYYFKSTAAHNTVVVDGQDQTPYVSTQQWGQPHAECELHRRDSRMEYEFMEASHTGYMRLDQPLLHRRWLLMGKQVQLLLVVDWLEGSGRHEVCQRYQLYPGSTVSLSGGDGSPYTSAYIQYPKTNIGMHMYWEACTAQEERHIHVTEKTGWISEIYGSKEETSVISAELTTEGISAIVTVIIPEELKVDAHEQGLAATDSRNDWIVERLLLDKDAQAVSARLRHTDRILHIDVDQGHVSWQLTTE